LLLALELIEIPGSVRAIEFGKLPTGGAEENKVTETEEVFGGL